MNKISFQILANIFKWRNKQDASSKAMSFDNFRPIYVTDSRIKVYIPFLKNKQKNKKQKKTQSFDSQSEA